MNPLRIPRRHLLGLLSGSLMLAAALPACALKPVFPQPLLDLSVIDRDTGETLTVYRHGGAAYVAGRPGARYALRIQSHAGQRVLAVVSVDGVNVLSGETAAWNQRGYVLHPGQHYDVTGWRKSDDEVAAFEFAALGDSYAARTGRPQQVGVLGVAVFLEKPEPVVAAPVSIVAPATLPMPLHESRAAPMPEIPQTPVMPPMPAPMPPVVQPAPAAQPALKGLPDAIRPQSVAGLTERLGTAHGEREYDHVSTVAFERLTPQPQLVLRIEYDSRENLVAAGVIPTTTRYGQADPFPANPPKPPQSYVPDPPVR